MILLWTITRWAHASPAVAIAPLFGLLSDFKLPFVWLPIFCIFLRFFFWCSLFLALSFFFSCLFFLAFRNFIDLLRIP